MNPEIEKLINLTIATGEITEKKRETIMRKAEHLGEDLDEVELILNGELALSKQKEKSDKQTYPSQKISDNKIVNISLLQVFMSFLNRYKLLKYSLIFVSICIGLNLISLLFSILI